MSPYYDRGGITLYHGDCRNVLPRLQLPTDTLVVTDPPYPGYDKGWDVPDIGAVLRSISCGGIAPSTFVVFWPPAAPWPMGDPPVEHVWHKPNGNSAHHYERIGVYGAGPRGCKVYRVPAILPNYVQYAAEAVDHPTQKPIRLLRALLGTYRGEPVLDPFVGSGTTLRAAKDLGRRAVGIEIEERYCEIAAKRLSQDVLPLFEEVS